MTDVKIAVEFHEYANLFPLMEGEEFESLVASIRELGLHEPIWLYEGKVLDGRNRYLACLEAGVEPKFQQYEGDDPLAFSVLKNVHRRQLSASQRAAIAVDILPKLEAEARQRQLSKLKQNAKTVAEKIPERTGNARDFAAQLLNVNPHYVSDAKRVKEVRPDLYEVMKAGGLHMKQALHEVHEEERAAGIRPAKPKKTCPHCGGDL
jgi:ParB-like chromosome segregation protein Spo0J